MNANPNPNPNPGNTTHHKSIYLNYLSPQAPTLVNVPSSMFAESQKLYDSLKPLVEAAHKEYTLTLMATRRASASSSCVKSPVAEGGTMVSSLRLISTAWLTYSICVCD